MSEFRYRRIEPPAVHIQVSESLGVVGRLLRLCAFPIRYILSGRAWL